MYHIGSFSHHALSTCTSAWTIPTYPFIYFGNIDLSTCRLVDLSTCRPVDLVLLSTTNIYICYLYVLPKLNCRVVDLSTCRPVDLSTCRPVELVLLSTTKIRLGLGLVCGSVYGWARVSRPVDLSTCRPSAIVNNKDPVRVRVSVSVWLGL